MGLYHTEAVFPKELGFTFIKTFNLLNNTTLKLFIVNYFLPQRQEKQKQTNRKTTGLGGEKQKVGMRRMGYVEADIPPSLKALWPSSGWPPVSVGHKKYLKQ